jgi:hypothetical protein
MVSINGRKDPSLRGDPSLTLRMTTAGFFVVILDESCRSEGSKRSDSFVLFDNPIALGEGAGRFGRRVGVDSVGRWRERPIHK